ncbi:MAG: hypothetical protein N2112_13860 [Gemmataceae bacterium]|jgi:hypothetical protein|nr:hypothetical protein [Gemmataceae bacterium]
MFRFYTLICTLVLGGFVCAAEDQLKLTLVAKKNTIPYSGGNQDPKEYKASIEAMIAKAKKGEEVRFPAPAEIDFVLKITNTGKEDVTILVGGDVNVYTLDFQGEGALQATPLLAFTADFRIGKPVTIPAGKDYEIPVNRLADGMRGNSRWLYLTKPGEYKVSATYQLAADEGGAKGKLLKSEPITVKVEAPK